MREPARALAPPGSVVVLGAGIMGTGMALAFARAGSHVAVTARRRSTLERSRRRLEESLDVLVRHRLIAPDAVEAVQERVMTAPFEALDLESDLIVESIVEDPAAKIAILARAEAGARPDTLIVTNTSSLALSELSRALDRPENFAGYHWFNPPELVELVEVIPGPETKDDTLRTLVDWAIAAGKRPVSISREIEGFVANRLQYALMREAYSLVEKGICTIEDIDQVMNACLGPRWAGVGPYEAMDLAGLDVHHEVARRLFPVLSNDTEPPRLLAELVAEGALGTKSGRGLHGDYDEATVQRLVERRTAVLAAVASVSQDRG
jgi:3-hydroxybutyryl-CoA dehydrogenase